MWELGGEGYDPEDFQYSLSEGERTQLARVREAIVAVNENADLTEHERAMLVSQLETKLRPLEQREWKPKG